MELSKVNAFVLEIRADIVSGKIVVDTPVK